MGFGIKGGEVRRPPTLPRLAVPLKGVGLPIPACPGWRGRRGPWAAGSRWLDQRLPGLRRWALRAVANPD